MNRKEIKELAKSKIKGNKWKILWPVLVIGLVEGVLENVLGLNPYMNADYSDLSTFMNTKMPAKVTIGILALSLVFTIVMVAYKKYILNFVRTGKFEINDIINCFKEKWLNIIIASVLVYIIVFLCSMLFAVPGIIMALAYSMATYIVIDSDLNGVESMKKSREMMKGYKWNYFVFGLSFIGWILLIPFTLGIILIWLMPYMTVADTLYYENLKKISKK